MIVEAGKSQFCKLAGRLETQGRVEVVTLVQRQLIFFSRETSVFSLKTFSSSDEAHLHYK